MIERTFTAGFLFCGLGAGARGFLEARAQLGDAGARFRSVGGVDNDRLACQDFERLTGSRATCADLATMVPAELRAVWGETAPDVVFSSPPCKGYSGLLSAKAAESDHYQQLNRLVLQGLWLLLESWPTPPALIVIENVPRITTRGSLLLTQVRQLLAGAGYLVHEGNHDCGEIGGLAQHRRRFLLVARRPTAVPAFVYRPPLQRVRACGEVLGPLPLPEDPAAGALHRLPRLSWVNWIRLALIPAGGDWRDLPPPATLAHEPRRGAFGVSDWREPSPTVRGRSDVRTGQAAVADPRIPLARTANGAGTFKGRPGLFGVDDWTQPAPAVTGQARVSAGNMPAAVADPRLSDARARFGNCDRVTPWMEPAGTVTHSPAPSSGAIAIAAPAPLPPLPPSYRLMTLEEALAKLDQGGSPPAGVVPVILSPRDGTWHRPLTTLELAVLQGLPAELEGAPLSLAGTSTAKHRERVGNAVPVGAGRAIGESLLQALLAAALGIWTLGSSGIWVREREATATAPRAASGER